MAELYNETPVTLGKTGIKIPVMGTGAWAWGDRLFWGFGGAYNEDDVRGAFDASLQGGVTFFDTAEAYGSGSSERLLGKFVHAAGGTSGAQPIVVATKFVPLPWRLSRKTLITALRRSLERLGVERVDLYQIHQPFPPMPIETWANALADALQAGLIRAAGVSNYGTSQTRRSQHVLEQRGYLLASNQVEYSLLERSPERNGLLEYCKEQGITLIAYSPIGKGILTGKYTPEKPPSGFRGRIYNRARLTRIMPLIGLMKEIGRAHEGKTPSQVALNWCICKGSVPIPGAKNARQAIENCGALGWRLANDEVAALDKASEGV